MDVYNGILKGIEKSLSGAGSIELRLRSLIPHVKSLRNAYRSSQVYVPYQKSEIQDAYLVTYFPHYYQLIYKILLEEQPDFFKARKNVSLTFIGGGPGSEIFGIAKYISSNAAHIRSLKINLLDINAKDWQHSHSIIETQLLKLILPSNCLVEWNTVVFDISSGDTDKNITDILSKSDLITIQNCLNEISLTKQADTANNIKSIFQKLAPDALLVIADMTSSARPLMKKIQNLLCSSYSPALFKTTLNVELPGTLLSLHSLPPLVVRQNLLTGESDLIPRKWIKYDYFIAGKNKAKEEAEPATGFNALYSPLNFKHLDVDDRITTSVFVGIDFGTSTAAIAISYIENGKLIVKPVPIPQKDLHGGVLKDLLVPCVMALKEGRLLVGQYAALYKQDLHLGIDCWYAFKANLKNLTEINYPDSTLKDHSVFKISNASEAFQLFLKYLKRELDKYMMESFPGRKVLYALSVPVGFGTWEKKQLKLAFNAAGIDCDDVPFIEEPNAALINHFYEFSNTLNENQKIKAMVLDIGAGTVDIALIQIEKIEGQVISNILSVKRDGKMGSEQIDISMAEVMKLSFPELNSLSDGIYHKLLFYCEELKKIMCKHVITDKHVNFKLPDIAKSELNISLPNPFHVTNGTVIQIGITYKTLYDLMHLYWYGTENKIGIQQSINDSLNEATCMKSDVDMVIITGGGGRNPYLRYLLAKEFPPEKLFISDNIQEQVARGTALHSLVVNSYGKPVLNSLLNHGLYVEYKGVKKKLFNRGQACPTYDEKWPLPCNDNTSTKIEVSDGIGNLIKYFKVSDPAEVKEFIFFVDPDLELRCEIITGTNIVKAEEFV